MAIESWQLTPYEFAARETCMRLNEDPLRLVQQDSGEWLPLWVSYAVRMHEMRVMQQAMQNYGMWGPL